MPHPPSQPFAPAWERAWLVRVNGDAEFRLISRWTAAALCLVSDGQAKTYRIDRSTIASSSETSGETAVLKGSSLAWQDFLACRPAAPNHSVLGMDRRRDDFAITHGREHFIRHLRVFTRALELMREPEARPA